MNRKVKKLMAYIYMPLIFLIIGYLLFAIALIPFYQVGYAMVNLVLAEESPSFSGNLDSIFTGLVTADIKQDESGESVEIVPMSQVQIPNYETHYAQLSCERIDLLAPVFYGDTNEVLRNGAGQYIGSFFPGFGGTILISGHNTTYFLPLKEIEIGDIIQMATNYGAFEYEVKDIEVHHKNDKDSVNLAQQQKEQLVLYTCYPFGEIIGIKQERKFIYADKISGPEVREVNNYEQ